MISEGLLDEGLRTAEGVYRSSPSPAHRIVYQIFLGPCMKLLGWALRLQKLFMRRNTTGELSIDGTVGVFFHDSIPANSTNAIRSLGYMRPLSIWSLRIALRNRKEKEEEEETKDSILIWGETLRPKLNVIFRRLIRTNGFKCNFNVFKIIKETAMSTHCDTTRALIFYIYCYLNLLLQSWKAQMLSAQLGQWAQTSGSSPSGNYQPIDFKMC